MKHTSKLQELAKSRQVSWILMYALLALIVLETFLHPQPHSPAVRGLATAILLLALNVQRKP